MEEYATKIAMDEKAINKIIAKHGSPQYIFDEMGFCNNYNRFFSAMSSCYHNYRLAYSYKTNYTPYICKLVKSMGGYAEVVSDMELETALRVGYQESQIIYNGPTKGERALPFLLNGGILNVDNTDEFIYLAKRTRTLGKSVKVGLRLNVDVGQSYTSRFGIDKAGLEEILSLCRDYDNISISGLHLHIGKARDIRHWERRTKEVIKIIQKYNFVNLEFIDLGSGMYGDMEESLAKQFSPNIPSYKDYALASAKILNDYIKDSQIYTNPILFTEPGTTLISRYVSFVATVKNIKKVNGKVIVGLDGSIDNLGGICRSKQLPIYVINRNINSQTVENADMVGYTCLEYDIVYKGYTGTISVGDLVVFGNVGGYSNVTKPPFILWGCGMTAINQNGMHQIKRNETFEDIFQTYLF